MTIPSADILPNGSPFGVLRVPAANGKPGCNTARFRLWAPSATQVAVSLSNEPLVTMQAMGDGWYEALIDDVPYGRRYRFELDGDLIVPDPASRFNPQDVHGWSEFVDPTAYAWEAASWHGRPWHEMVIYELHVGTFTAGGTFLAAIDRLDELCELGITAIELMPVAQFAGLRNWGYDGVLLFAPDPSYGHPDDLKRLIDQAHLRGIAVLLDVVYNHFGPDGNYLHAYASAFFNDQVSTPWGAAINFDQPGSDVVRRFFLDNARYWLEEFRLDGLRLDAVHAISDTSEPGFVSSAAQAVARIRPDQVPSHLVLENDRNQSSLLRKPGAPRESGATAQWNDDWHHAIHCLLTGESDGYYRDYADRPAHHLARALAEGFAYQGEPSAHRGGVPRGESTHGWAPTAFIAFIQNHDQVGNRAFGERLGPLLCARLGSAAGDAALRLSAATLLLAPSIPMLFMGEEFDSRVPFLYFCDHKGPLGDAVREGRRREFGGFAGFRSEAARAAIPDPNAASSMAGSIIEELGRLDPAQREMWAHYRDCIAARRRYVIPLLHGDLAPEASWQVVDEAAMAVQWQFVWPEPTDGLKASRLMLWANFSDHSVLFDESNVAGGAFAFSVNGARWRDSRLALDPYGLVLMRQDHP